MRSVVLVVLVACGPSTRDQARREAEQFDCKDRHVSYMTSHHMSGDEIGVQMDCAERGPRIKRWKTTREGKRIEDGHPLSPGEFEDIWRQIDGVGWVFLRDCTNGTGGKTDPVYMFEVKDDQNQSTFSCQTVTMPYPYSAIVNPLDLAAAQGRKQLGDDEPDDLKALDKKRPK
jgi:hypothetical protein